jgi:hypothetical protein
VELSAVTSTLEEFPPFVDNPMIDPFEVPAVSELVGIGDADANAAKLCRIAAVTLVKVLSPVAPGRTPPLALPSKVRVVPVNIMSGVPDVEPVSRSTLWPTERVTLPLLSARAAIGSASVRTAIAIGSSPLRRGPSIAVFRVSMLVVSVITSLLRFIGHQIHI